MSRLLAVSARTVRTPFGLRCLGSDWTPNGHGEPASYTANGELETKTCGAEVTTYTYDDFGNLTHATMPDQGFLYGDQLNPVAELDGSGAVTARFVCGTKPNVSDYMVKDGITYRYVTGQLGSVRLVVDAATGTIAQRIDYDEYGVVIQDSNPGFQPFGFAGGITDTHTGLVRFGARDYHPVAGRWTSKDPIGMGLHPASNVNVYVYALGDPVGFLDGTGLDALCFYDVRTHTLFCIDTGSGSCFSTNRTWSGRGFFRDEPGFSPIRDYGPIPAGEWRMGCAGCTPRHRVPRVPLTPSGGTNTFGRGPFQIHPAGGANSSHGCLVMPLAEYRNFLQFFRSAGDRGNLQVQ